MSDIKNLIVALKSWASVTLDGCHSKVQFEAIETIEDLQSQLSTARKEIEASQWKYIETDGLPTERGKYYWVCFENGNVVKRLCTKAGFLTPAKVVCWMKYNEPQPPTDKE